MLLFAAIVGAVIAAGVLCTTFWNNILAWIKKGAEKIKEKLKKVAYGAVVLAKKIRGKLKKISRNYVRTGPEWEEIEITKEVTEDEVPDFVRCLEEGEETDITEELQLQPA